MSWWFVRWLLRRVTFAVPVLWGVATLTFAGLHMLPGSAAATIAGGTSAVTPAQIAYVTREYGLDRPLRPGRKTATRRCSRCLTTSASPNRRCGRASTPTSSRAGCVSAR